MSKARNMARMGQDTSAGYTGAFDMPAGTTAQRPASAGLGWTRLNTDTGSVEVYDGTNWNAVTRPFISSVTGTIYAGAASNLVIAGQNFTSTITIRFLEGGSTVADVTGVSVSSGSATVAVPAAVYGQTAGDTIDIRVINSDGTLSANQISKTVQALPTGGTITTAGGYRYHTFTSSGNFVVPSGFTSTAEYLLVAGGGSHRAGQHATGAGGGGAGGAIDSTVSLSAQTYSIVIGAGGAGASGAGNGSSGDNSTAFGQTAIGGGRGAGYSGYIASNGGSGGGGGYDGSNQGAGTVGQGYAGGSGVGGENRGGGGGGGAGGVGGNATAAGSATVAGNGGVGINWKSLGTYYAGGGGGGVAPWTEGGKTAGTGGLGGGGNGARSSSQVYTAGSPGAANTGGGAGGASVNGPSNGSGDNLAAANGGSGIVIVRYAL